MTLSSHTLPSAVAYTESGDRYAVARPNGEVCIHDTLTGRPLQRLSRLGERHSSCRVLVFSPDGRRLFLGPVGLTAGVLWDLEQGRVISDLWDDDDPLAQQHTCFSAAFSPNGRLLAVADFEYVYLYDAQGRVLERRSTEGQVPARLTFVAGELRVDDEASDWGSSHV